MPNSLETVKTLAPTPLWGEHISTFKLDVYSLNIGELMLSFSLIKVVICSPILSEYMSTFELDVFSPNIGEHMYKKVGVWSPILGEHNQSLHFFTVLLI